MIGLMLMLLMLTVNDAIFVISDGIDDGDDQSIANQNLIQPPFFMWMVLKVNQLISHWQGRVQVYTSNSLAGIGDHPVGSKEVGNTSQNIHPAVIILSSLPQDCGHDLSYLPHDLGHDISSSHDCP